ncbi:MAG: efflux RND transporter periplasmic adaptor subunit [Myxococcaceae bacterium]
MARWSVVVSLVVVSMALSGCSSDAVAAPTRKAAPKPAVQLSKVERAELSRPVQAIGFVAAHREAKLSFKVGGVVQQVLTEEGATVKRGQLLARIDPKEIDAQVVFATNGFDKAKRDLERAKKLHAEDVATTQQLQDATTQLEIAQAQLDVARFNQAHATIRAPFDGRVLKRLAEPEELVGPGTPVLALSSTEGGWVVKAGVPDREALALAEGDPAKVRLDALGVTLDATVTEVPTAAGPTGLFELELSLANAPKRLASGVVANIEIAPSSKRPYSVLPVESLVEGDGHKGWVFTVDAGKVKKQAVSVAYFEGDKAMVDGALDGVDQVVTAGAGWLTDGEAVEVAP